MAPVVDDDQVLNSVQMVSRASQMHSDPPAFENREAYQSGTV